LSADEFCALGESGSRIGADEMITFSSGAAGGGVLIGVLFLAGLYFLPTIIAASRKVPNVGSVVVINVFLGWTFIGWVVALAMAARSAANPVSATAAVNVVQDVGAPTLPSPGLGPQSQEGATAAHCPNGHPVHRDARFCSICGSALGST
jgi:hypothetical protein